MLRAESGDPERVFRGFELYTLRHTCLTRWAPHMDPWTLAYLAGHQDMNITKRYIHPQQQTVLDAMEKARSAKGGHISRHSAENVARGQTPEASVIN
jgi:integrase